MIKIVTTAIMQAFHLLKAHTGKIIFNIPGISGVKCSLVIFMLALERFGYDIKDGEAAVRAFHARKLNVHCHCNGNATGQVFVDAIEEVA